LATDTDEKDEISAHAYQNVALYLCTYHDRFCVILLMMRRRIAKNSLRHLLERFSPYAIYVMASKAGMTEMTERFILDAFKDAYARGQFDVALSMYEDMKSQPAMAQVLLEFGKSNDLQLDLIQCMQVKRNAYAVEIEALGEKLRYYFFAKAESMNENQTYSKEDFARIERLHTLMGNYFFLRGFSTRALRAVGAIKLKEWGGGLAGYLSEEKRNIFPYPELRFMQLQSSYNNMRAEYLMRNYVKALESHGDETVPYEDHEHDSIYTIHRANLLRDFPEFEHDPRFLTIDLEASRIFANAFNEGWNRALAPGEEGYYEDLVYDDDDAADLAAIFRGNSLGANLLKSREYFLRFFEIASQHPEHIGDRTQLYRSRKTLGVIEGRLGNLRSSMGQFFDARSDAVKYGDHERYGDVLLAMSTAIPKMVQYYQLTKDQKTALEILRQLILYSVMSRVRFQSEGRTNLLERRKAWRR
jgi:hypothetical protein